MILKSTLIGIFLILLIGVFLSLTYFSGREVVTVQIGDTVVHTEVVTELEDRIRGLSGRKSLAEDTGMLFVFPEDGLHSMWMKDMNFPIDILYLTTEKEVVYIKHSALPASYPEKFIPPSPVRYILEVPAGYAIQHNITIGEKAAWK